MARLLERYIRRSDNKSFAVIRVGAFKATGEPGSAEDEVLLESEDGEQIESRSSALLEHGEFDLIED